MMENEKNMPQKWINTPFAFTRLSRNLSLLQQAVLVKVSEQLQPYIKEYFGNKQLRGSQMVPKPLFSESAKNAGVSQIYISYAEMGVTDNNFFAVKEAMKEVLNIKVEGPIQNEDGSWGLQMYNVFLSGDASYNSNGVVFCLNPQIIDKDRRMYVVDKAFDMTEDYVSHPDNIALIGTNARMPMIYYLLRKTSGHNWNARVFSLTVNEIKKYLGMIEIVGGKLIKEAYPKFSQFKKNVLDMGVADINRLKACGQLDVCVSYEPVYNGKRKVGNPAFVRFHVYDDLQQMAEAEASKVQQDMFAASENRWRQFLATYKGTLLSELQDIGIYAFDDKQLIWSVTPDQRERIEQQIERMPKADLDEFRRQLFQACGRQIKIGYHIIEP